MQLWISLNQIGFYDHINDIWGFIKWDENFKYLSDI
jgi:hypothetical protein